MNKLDHIYKPMKVKTPINRPTNRLIATMLFNLKIENCRLNIVRLNETVYLINQPLNRLDKLFQHAD